jgi:sulfatase maturation enzyme AslB (radical SAM superfamily)
LSLRNQIGVSLSNNEVIHNKLYHKKGIPTYEQTVTHLQRIATQGNRSRFRLTMLAQPYAVADMEAFWSQFSSEAQRRINLVWQPYELSEANIDATSESTTLSNRGSTEKNGELCQQLLPPRLHQVILYADSSVYMAVPRKPGEDKPQGVLCEDGSIRWDELERENILSKQWFENHKCSGCKHLPLLVGICSKQKVPLGMICPIDNNLVTPDSVIVKEFESRQ